MRGTAAAATMEVVVVVAAMSMEVASVTLITAKVPNTEIGWPPIASKHVGSAESLDR